MDAPRIPGSAGTAAGIYDLRRLKTKHGATPVGKARSVLDFCLRITQNVQVTPETTKAYRHGRLLRLVSSVLPYRRLIIVG